MSTTRNAHGPVAFEDDGLRRGRRFFRDDNDKATLTLKRTETASTGVTMLVCEPAEA
jgi:hypothetical protein